jgi:hypothetical protein
MNMTTGLRKFVFTSHVTLSVGWLGAVIAYLALAITGLISSDALMLPAAYLGMNVIIQFVIVPLSLAALLTGLVQSLGTEWGLFRHYWIVAKLVLTVIAIAVLLMHMPAVNRMASQAGEMVSSSVDLHMLRVQLLVHAAGGLLVLIVVTLLSIYKPWGRTRLGQV